MQKKLVLHTNAQRDKSLLCHKQVVRSCGSHCCHQYTKDVSLPLFHWHTNSMSSVCRTDKGWQSACLPSPPCVHPCVYLHAHCMDSPWRLSGWPFVMHFCHIFSQVTVNKAQLCCRGGFHCVCKWCCHQWNVITVTQTKKRLMQCVVLHLWSSGNDPFIVSMCLQSLFSCYLEPGRDVCQYLQLKVNFSPFTFVVLGTLWIRGIQCWIHSVA